MSDDRIGHLCTVTNASWILHGRDFNENGKIVVTRSSSYETANFSFLIWIYIKSGATKGTSHIVDKAFTSHVDPYYTWTIQLIDPNTSTPDLKFIVPLAAFLDADDSLSLLDISAIVNTWALIAVTYDGTTMYMDINGGQRTGSKVNTGTLAYYDTPLTFGVATNPAGRDFYGRMSRPRLLNQAISATQIADIYQQERHLVRV